MKKFILAAACIFALGTSLSAQSPAKTDSVKKEATAKCCSGKSKQCDCKAGAACSTPEGAKVCEAYHAAVQDSTKSCCKTDGKQAKSSKKTCSKCHAKTAQDSTKSTCKSQGNHANCTDKACPVCHPKTQDTTKSCCKKK